MSLHCKFKINICLLIVNIVLAVLLSVIFWAAPLSEHLLQSAARDSGIILRILLCMGADPNARNDSGETALIIAAGNNKNENVKVLLNYGAEINDMDREYGHTALMYAVQAGYSEIVGVLTGAGADANCKDPVTDKTALMVAAENGQLQMVECLIKAGAYISARDNERRQAADYAKANGHQAIVQLLEEEKAKQSRLTEILKNQIDITDIIRWSTRTHTPKNPGEK